MAPAALPALPASLARLAAQQFEDDDADIGSPATSESKRNTPAGAASKPAPLNTNGSPIGNTPPTGVKRIAGPGGDAEDQMAPPEDDDDDDDEEPDRVRGVQQDEWLEFQCSAKPDLKLMYSTRLQQARIKGAGGVGPLFSVAPGGGVRPSVSGPAFSHGDGTGAAGPLANGARGRLGSIVAPVAPLPMPPGSAGSAAALVNGRMSSQDGGSPTLSPTGAGPSPTPSASASAAVAAAGGAGRAGGVAGAAGIVSPPTPAGASGADQDERTFDRLSEAVGHIQRNVELISLYSGLVGQSLTESMVAIKQQVAAADAAITRAREEAKRAALEEKSDVDYLIGWSKLHWDFAASPAVKAYRVSSQQSDLEAMRYTEWHLPQYFSQLPLLPTQNRLTCSVALPFGAITQSQILVGPDDVVSAAIAKLLQKQPKSGSNSGGPSEPSGWVLKVLGLNEYFDGEHKFFEYAHVRKALRDNLDTVELVLTHRPAPLESKEQQQADQDAIAAYRHKIPHNQPIINKGTHRDVPTRIVPGTGLPQSVLMSSVNVPFRIKVGGIDGVTSVALACLNSEITHVTVRAALFHGSSFLDFVMDTTPAEVCESISLQQTLQGSASVMLSLLPRETRLGIILIGLRGAPDAADPGKEKRDRDRADKDGKDGEKEKDKEKDKREVILGWCAVQLIDESGTLVAGHKNLRLYPAPHREGKKHGKKAVLSDGVIFRASTAENRATNAASTVVRVDFDRFRVPVVAPLAEDYKEPLGSVCMARDTDDKVRVSRDGKARGADGRLDLATSGQLWEAINSDPLQQLTAEQRQVLWECRDYLTTMPQALPKVLSCVHWGKQHMRHEAHRLLKIWAPPATPLLWMELLDVKYADYTVREHAVGCLDKLADDQLQLFLLQLVQCLKNEPYHDSPLSRFLLIRAVLSPYEVGHALFWHLKAELHDHAVTERFAVILEEFLSYVGRLAGELRKQCVVVQRLQKIAENVVTMRREQGWPDPEVREAYEADLNRLNESLLEKLGSVTIPLNPRWQATTLIVKKCRYMSSKMVPLWLVFKNADETAAAPPITVIFKSGDDLRQDLLTLQLLRVMDSLWLSDKLDMRLKPYSCIATGVNDEGEGVGMIEVVLNSDTTSGIQIKYGGGAFGALKLEPIDLFIREHNRTPTLHNRAVDNFVRSCAGYCVATFVLGIGDRHNGNIMVTKSGHLFHIDFGHFLGNFKTKMGVNRERAAFVFTPEMAYVMGGKNYAESSHFEDFKRHSAKAFRVLRANAALIEILFIVMVGAGMPELMSESDIGYLRNRFYLQVAPKVANKRLMGEISRSLDNTYRRIDNYIHNLVHG